MAEALRKKVKLHPLTASINESEEPGKRTRGRPKKGAEPLAPRKVLRVCLDGNIDRERFEEQLAAESVFILVTLPDCASTDAELLAACKDQAGVDNAFRWLKEPASVAPIFLEKEERIAALALIYVLAYMVYTLIQRRMRAKLAEQETTVPGNKGRTAKPTTEVIFRLMRGIQSMRWATADGREVRALLGVTTEQKRALEMASPSSAAKASTQASRSQDGDSWGTGQ